MTKAGMRLREELATLRAENAQLRERLAKFEDAERRRREAEDRMARQYDNLFAYTGVAQMEDVGEKA